NLSDSLFQAINFSSRSIVVFLGFVNPIFNGFFLSVKLNKRIILNLIVVQQCLYFLVCRGQFLLGFGNPLFAAFKGTSLERNFLFQPIYLVEMLVILYVFLVVV